MKNDMDIRELYRPNIRSLAPYSTARDEYRGELGIFLDANENPYDNGCNRYPDPRQRELKRRLSEIKGVAPEKIFVGNGSDEPIDLAFRVFCEPRLHNAVSIAPTYGMYKVAAAINDVPVREVPLEPDFSLDERKLLAATDGDTRLLLLCSPNNPTGNCFPRAQIERIVKMRISPINVSVHTTDPELRVRMMRNKDAGRVLGYLDTLAAGGIALNVQLVLCHTVNDGAALARSLDDLLRLDTLASVACVPAGLTAHRANLTPLTPFDRESACAVLDLLDEKAPAFYEKFGARTIYAADEFFLTAGRPLPDASYYEGYPQLENGVGMLRCHTDEFAAALAETAAAAPGTPFTCVTGEAAYDHICALVKAAKEKIPGLVGDVAKIRNDFYGPSITVAGLLVGRDIIAQLRARGHHGRLILPSCMLRAEGDLFLDDTTLPQLSEALGAAVTVAGPTGEELLRAMLADE